MKYVAPVRKELGIRTIFNILGPLVNPAGAKMELIGVYEQELVEPVAKALANLGVRNAMVVYGQDGLDEISLSAPTSVCEVRDGWLRSYEITPEQYGFTRCSKSDITGGTAAENASIIRDILNGARSPKRDAAILNAAAGLYVAKGITFESALALAEEMIDSGKALLQLEALVKESNSSAKELLSA
jgi:anthranilate phosphoribosyltransferase